MRKIVWSCWLQGRIRAPWLVEQCLRSWEERNPEWDVRCLDQGSLARYIDVPDLSTKQITPTSYSDIVRILLLRTHGGVWTDATVYCNRPLDDWLEELVPSDFFAFANPGGGRLLSSWFLAGEAHHAVFERWCAVTLEYWAQRALAHDYFWFHHLFAELYGTEPAFAAAWDEVPKRSADGPHAIQTVGLFETNPVTIRERVDWRCPVFKLTYRLDERQCVPGTLLARLLGPAPCNA
jgi:hypothetical protein